MDINQLSQIVKKKIETNFKIEKILIEDRTFLHVKHKSHQKGKFHIKIFITSNYLKKFSKIESNKKIFKLIENELKKYIHSIQILIN